MNKQMKNSIEKIVVNSSFGKIATSAPEFNDKILPEIAQAFAAIVGQKGQERPARVSISGFKLREGIIIGLKATLRGARARQFLGKLVHIVLPRVRDFRGIKRSGVDEHGNLTFGIKEHIVFPEIILEKTRVNFGIEVTIVPTARMTPEQGIVYYAGLGIPFEKEVKDKKMSK